MEIKPEEYQCPSCRKPLDFGKISHHYYCDDEQLEFSEDYLKGYWDCHKKFDRYLDHLSKETLEKIGKEIEGDLE